jgi:quinol monooxygenase YgiN
MPPIRHAVKLYTTRERRGVVSRTIRDNPLARQPVAAAIGVDLAAATNRSRRPKRCPPTPGGAMLAIVAKLNAQPGKGAELAQAMNTIAGKVRANESGNHAYNVHRGTENADLVMIYELYDDEEALNAHRQHMKEMGVNLAELLAGKPELEYFETA